MTDDFISLDELALALSTGGADKDKQAKPAKQDKIGDFLKSPSGEGNLTCEQAMSTHCSAACTTKALELLRDAQKKQQ